MQFFRRTCESVAVVTDTGVDLARRDVSRLSWMGERCTTTTKAVQSAVNRCCSAFNASSPPADAPMPSTCVGASGRLERKDGLHALVSLMKTRLPHLLLWIPRASLREAATLARGWEANVILKSWHEQIVNFINPGVRLL